MEADDYVLQFEQTRFRLITSSEEVAATAGGLGGLLGAVTTAIYFSRSEHGSSFLKPPDISLHARSAGPAPTSLPLPSISLSSEGSEAPHIMTAPSQTVAESTVAHDKTVPVEYQVGGVIGVVAFAAFAAAALTTSIRYMRHKHKEHFKSDISDTELRSWYDSPSASATKDV